MALRLTEKQAADMGLVPPSPSPPAPDSVPTPRVVVHRLNGLEFIIAASGGWLVGFICGISFPH